MSPHVGERSALKALAFRCLTLQDVLKRPENDAEAKAWLDTHQHRFGHFIDNKWRRGRKTFSTLDPVSGEVLATLTNASSADVDAAVKSARAAHRDWEAIGCHGRAKYLYALARAIQKHSRLFATLESIDNGKPIRESRDIDIPLVARHFYYHAGCAQLRDASYPGYESIGVVGQIIPWNFPMLMLAWKVAPALAMGNTVVLKPAEDTSLTAVLFAQVCAQVGLPPGVFNLYTVYHCCSIIFVFNSATHRVSLCAPPCAHIKISSILYPRLLPIQDVDQPKLKT